MNFEAVDQLIRKEMRLKNTPGLAIAAVKDGKTIYSNGFGCRNLKRFEPMNADTLIGIGSITKSITAFAILKLQDQGMLNIEDSAGDYLEYPLFKRRPEIKIKHMLSHTSGVPSLDACNQRFTYAFDNFRCVYPATSVEDFMGHLADGEDFIIFEPGEKFFYNNDMYTCLGFVIEVVTGQSFADFVRKEILSPLEMDRAVFTEPALNKDANAMTGYRFEGKEGKRQISESTLPIGGFVQAPGGLYAPMNEMLNYAQCLLDKGAFKGAQVLSAESVDLLFTPQTPTSYGRGEDPHYGLGWSVERYDESPLLIWQHGGGMNTSTSFLLLAPELNLGVVSAENANTIISSMACRAVVEMVLGREPAESLEDLRIASIIKEISGTYRSAHNMYEFEVGLKDGVLQASAGIDDGSMNFPLLPKDCDALRFAVYSLKKNNHAEVAFYRDEKSGRVAYAAYDRYLYKRV